MNHSENINELASALAKAQGEMQAAIKDCINPFFKSKYADLGSVWDAARPVLSKNNLCVMQTTEIVNERIVLVTTLIHSSGQWMKSCLPLNPSKNDAQGIGAAMTYLRRYALSALVGVVCDDEDDGETAVGRGKAKTDLVTKDQIHVLHVLFSQLDDDNKLAFLKWIKEKFNFNVLEEIHQNHFDKCLQALNAKLKYIKDQKQVA